MINAAIITEAVKTLLDDGLSDEYKVERGEYVNTDPDNTPWVGVYRGPIEYDPSTLGGATLSWKADVSVLIIIQAATLKAEASDAEDDLEGYINDVLTIMMDNKTFAGLNSIIKNVDVSYSYNEAKSSEMYYQNATIEIITEVRTQ